MDELAKPKNSILNYNTQWSGMTPELLANVKTTLKDIQDKFLQFVNSDTILIGHSLENDLIALQVRHAAPCSIADNNPLLITRAGCSLGERAAADTPAFPLRNAPIGE